MGIVSPWSARWGVRLRWHCIHISFFTRKRNLKWSEAFYFGRYFGRDFRPRRCAAPMLFAMVFADALGHSGCVLASQVERY